MTNLNTFAITTQWAEIANNKQNTAEDYVAYTLLRYIAAQNENTNSERKNPIKRPSFYLLRAFTPVTNHNKLTNGRYSYDTLLNAVRHFMYTKGYTMMMSVNKLGVVMTEELVNAIAREAHDALVEIKREIA